MAEELYRVESSVPEFGMRPYTYLNVDGKWGVISPWLGLKAGDVIIVRRAASHIEELRSDQDAAAGVHSRRSTESQD